jgi:hypothetical protein
MDEGASNPSRRRRPCAHGLDLLYHSKEERMRKRNFRKIMLTKETLRNLDDAAMRDMAGGITGGHPQTCNISCATDATRICSNCNTCVTCPGDCG